MKKVIFTLSFLIMFGAAFSQKLIIDFDDIESQLAPWEGTQSIVDNPKKDGINTSDHACLYVNPADKNWANAATVVFKDTIEYRLLDSIQFMVYSPIAKGMAVKLESQLVEGEAQPITYSATAASDEWQLLTFKFSGVSGADSIAALYDKITIFFNIDDNEGDQNWIFDNVVVFPESAVRENNSEPVDPEYVLLSDWDTMLPAWYFNDESNAGLYQATESNGVDESGSGKFTTNESLYNLIMFNYDDGFTWAEEGNSFKMKIKAPTMGITALKFENSDKSVSMGGDWMNMTKTDEYQEFIINMDDHVAAWKVLNPEGDINSTFTRMIIFFDLDNDVAGNDWYIDDISVPKGFVSDTYLGSIEMTNTSLQNSKLESVNLYPNPVSDILNIDQNGSITSLEIFNTAGVLVQSGRIENSSHQVDVSTLEGGIYFIKLSTANGNSSTYKFIK